jgi:hypothetical protein
MIEFKVIPPARLETYYDESTPAQSSWSGEISDSLGLTNTKCIKYLQQIRTH